MDIISRLCHEGSQTVHVSDVGNVTLVCRALQMLEMVAMQMETTHQPTVGTPGLSSSLKL